MEDSSQRILNTLFKHAEFYVLQKLGGTTMKTITLNVTGMHCTSCEVLLTDSLTELIGVKKAVVSASKGTAIIDFDETKVSKENIITTIKKEKYGVQ